VASETYTILDGDRIVEVRGRAEEAGAVLDPGSVRDALGWELHDGQLCSDAMCIPVAGDAGLERPGGLDLEGLARALGRPLALDVAARAACLGAPAHERRQALASLHAPDFSLPDLDGRPHALSEQRGKKVLLVVWGSW
jgi:hypothetical protein